MMSRWLLMVLAAYVAAVSAQQHRNLQQQQQQQQQQATTFTTFSEYEETLLSPAVDFEYTGGGGSDGEGTFNAVASTQWPEYNPPGPYFFDTQCFGRFSNTCLKSSPNCQWYTAQGPACYDKRFVSVTVPHREPVPFHVQFFQFNYGVHLVEGTFFKRFYSLTVDECARLCIKSAGGFPSFPGQKRRCLSFDFYPFETWKSEAPYYESQDRGICALNSDTKNTARMRNEDQGFTDAEYYYRSHCTRRPFHPADGYYEVRDTRGTLTPLLDYAGPTGLGLESPWGGSRWGMFHPNMPGYLPTSLVPSLQCSLSSSSDSPKGPVFRGGFTPVTDDQHCPGLMTKSEARDLCTQRGGELCRNKADLDAISGRKLGCSFDQAGNQEIWHEELPDKGKMWPRCCASYVMPLSNSPALEESGSFEDSCTPYQEANINFCAKFKTVTECVYSHTPNDPASANPTSWKLGSGRGLDEIRNLCLKRSIEIPGYNCSQMDIEFWKTATNCIWCPQAGLDPVGGNGECRAGGDFGVCPTGSTQQRQVFGLRARSTCAEMTNCVLIAKYPDLGPYMGNYTFVDDSIIGGAESAAPSKKGTTNVPTKKPSYTPTSKPTTNLPTKKPSASPTSKPTAKQAASTTGKPSSTGSLLGDLKNSKDDDPTQVTVTLRPTLLPSTAKTIQPTAAKATMTTMPTKKATANPTVQPSKRPSAFPTKKQPTYVLPDFTAQRGVAPQEEVVEEDENEEEDEE